MYDDLEAKTNVDIDPVRFADEDFEEVSSADLLPEGPTGTVPLRMARTSASTATEAPSSIAPFAVDVVASPLDPLDRSSFFSWPPPPPTQVSSRSIVVMTAVSAFALLALVASFAVSPTSAADPVAAVMPRTAQVTEAKTAIFASVSLPAP